MPTARHSQDSRKSVSRGRRISRLPRFTHLLRPARLLGALYGSDRFPSHRRLLLPGFQRDRPVAGYNYSIDWTPLLAGLSPAGMAARLAARHTPSLPTNITGLTGEVTSETWGKRLELAIQVGPAISRVAVLWNPDVLQCVPPGRRQRAPLESWASHCSRLRIEDSPTLNRPSAHSLCIGLVLSSCRRSTISTHGRSVSWRKPA